MMMMLNAKTLSDQNGYASIDSSDPMALRPAAKMPIQRPNAPPPNSENAAVSSSAPMISVTQPHVCSPLMMYVELLAKNFESPIAAMPQITFSTPAIPSIMPAKS